MAHNLQERYSSLVLAKLRNELIFKDGVVFNNDYEGDPSAGAVKVVVRDTEVQLTDYDKLNGIEVTEGGTSYMTIVIDKDVAFNEIIDGYDAASVPDKLVADRLDSGTYVIEAALDGDGGDTLVNEGTSEVLAEELTKDNIYSVIVDYRTKMTKKNIKRNGRFLIASPDTMALILKSPEFISASALGDEVKQAGIVGRIANFNIIEGNLKDESVAFITGHPDFCTRIREFVVAPRVQNLDGDGRHIGACAVQGRKVYKHKVTIPSTVFVVKNSAEG